MNISELHKFLEHWRTLGFFPSSDGWPDAVTIPTPVWEKFKDIMKYTSGDGYEYAVSLFMIDGETVVTPYTRGTRENVVTREGLQVKYVPKDKNYYEKQIISKGKIIRKETVKASKVPKQVKINYLFNVHTHPIQKDSYSFFSGTDIRSFLGSNVLAMGVLTDRLWLACKTDKSLKTLGENGEEILQEISQRIFDGTGNVEEMIVTLLANWGIVFYRGGINETLKKVI